MSGMAHRASTDAAAKALDRFVLVPLGKLAVAPWNFKVEDAEAARKLVNSLAQGQLQNLVVRELEGTGDFVTEEHVAVGSGTYETVDGNHRVFAYNELARQGRAPSHVVCYSLGAVGVPTAVRVAHQMTEFFRVDALGQAKALMLTMNEIPLAEIAEMSPFTMERLSDITGLLGKFPEVPEAVGVKSKTYNLALSWRRETDYHAVVDWLTKLAATYDEEPTRQGFCAALAAYVAEPSQLAASTVVE